MNKYILYLDDSINAERTKFSTFWFFILEKDKNNLENLISNFLKEVNKIKLHDLKNRWEKYFLKNNKSRFLIKCSKSFQNEIINLINSMIIKKLEYFDFGITEHSINKDSYKHWKEYYIGIKDTIKNNIKKPEYSKKISHIYFERHGTEFTNKKIAISLRSLKKTRPWFKNNKDGPLFIESSNKDLLKAIHFADFVGFLEMMKTEIKT